jgi:hypothetical protein
MTDFREEIEAQMRPFRDLGRAALPATLAASIDTLKVRNKLLQALGAIERADSAEQAEDVSNRATTYALSARDHDGDLSISDWHALDSHIRERIAAAALREPKLNIDVRWQDGRTESVDVSKAEHSLVLGDFASKLHLSESAGSGKGKSVLPGSTKFDPLTAARTESVFMLQLLEQASGVTLGDEQKQTFLTVLSDLPEGATVLDLLDAILGVPPEHYEPLAPLFNALQKMQEEGVHADLFTQHADK